MNTTQKVVTGMMAVLMLGTILSMPSRMPGHGASPAKRIGVVVTAPAQSPAELPQGGARDRTTH